MCGTNQANGSSSSSSPWRRREISRRHRGTKPVPPRPRGRPAPPISAVVRHLRPAGPRRAHAVLQAVRMPPPCRRAPPAACATVLGMRVALCGDKTTGGGRGGRGGRRRRPMRVAVGGTWGGGGGAGQSCVAIFKLAAAGHSDVGPPQDSAGDTRVLREGLLIWHRGAEGRGSWWGRVRGYRCVPHCNDGPPQTSLHLGYRGVHTRVSPRGRD